MTFIRLTEHSIHLPASIRRTFHSGTSDNRDAYVMQKKKIENKIVSDFAC